jgi:hypothetical protein
MTPEQTWAMSAELLAAGTRSRLNGIFDLLTQINRKHVSISDSLRVICHEWEN